MAVADAVIVTRRISKEQTDSSPANMGAMPVHVVQRINIIVVLHNLTMCEVMKVDTKIIAESHKQQSQRFL